MAGGSDDAPGCRAAVTVGVAVGDETAGPGLAGSGGSGGSGEVGHGPGRWRGSGMPDSDSRHNQSFGAGCRSSDSAALSPCTPAAPI